MDRAASPSARAARARRHWVDLLWVLFLVAMLGAGLRHCAVVGVSGPLERYEARWDHADGRVASYVLILHADRSFVFVRQVWIAGRKADTIESHGTQGTWTTDMLGNHLHPYWHWENRGLDFRRLQVMPVEHGRATPWRRASGRVDIGPGPMTGRAEDLPLPSR